MDLHQCDDLCEWWRLEWLARDERISVNGCAHRDNELYDYVQREWWVSNSKRNGGGKFSAATDCKNQCFSESRFEWNDNRPYMDVHQCIDLRCFWCMDRR